MTTDAAVEAFQAERDRIARLTRLGIGMPAAGLLYWISVAFVLRRWEPESALVICFVLTGPVFPIGYAITRLAGGDLFAKSATLTPLGVQLAAMQLFYWPIIVVVYRNAIEWTPFTLAVLFGSHVLPYGWLYRSRAYVFLTASIGVVLSGAAIVTRSALYLTVPILAAACYAVALVIMAVEVRSLTRDGHAR